MGILRWFDAWVYNLQYRNRENTKLMAVTIASIALRPRNDSMLARLDNDLAWWHQRWFGRPYIRPDGMSLEYDATLREPIGYSGSCDVNPLLKIPSWLKDQVDEYVREFSCGKWQLVLLYKEDKKLQFRIEPI